MVIIPTPPPSNCATCGAPRMALATQCGYCGRDFVFDLYAQSRDREQDLKKKVETRKTQE